MAKNTITIHQVAKWKFRLPSFRRHLPSSQFWLISFQLFLPITLMLIIILLGYSLAFPKDQFQLAKENLVKNPDDIDAHLVLAEEFLDNHQYQKAEDELLKIERIKDLKIQEGEIIEQEADLKIQELWLRKKESDPQDIKWLIKQWEKVIARKPDYRDGHLYLALLHFKLRENYEARIYLNKAIELDPNYLPSRQLESTLNQ